MRLKDLGQLFDGPHATPRRVHEGPYFLNITSLSRGRLLLEHSDRVDEEQFARWTRRVTPQEGDLLFSYETRLGEAALMPGGVRACLGRRMALLRPNRDVAHPRFLLYWYLAPAMQTLIEQRTVLGATVPRILLSEMPDWPVSVPPLPEQQAIAEVLGALDDKIAANANTKITTLSLGTYLIQQAANMGETATVGDIAEFLNRRRVPLSSRERATRQGSVPYWGANGQLDSVDEALFNAPLVLVGEDGTVISDSGKAVVHHIWGPSWVNNHAHVLTGRTMSTEALWFLLQDLDVTRAITGAVQPKLSMGNLKSITLKVPSQSDQSRLEALVQPLAASYRNTTMESRTLAELRDTLLPALMDGTLRVKDAITRVEEAI